MESNIRRRTIKIDGQSQSEPLVSMSPQSPYVCLGCKLSVRGSISVETPLRPITGVSVREFSWVISPDENGVIKAIAYPVFCGAQMMPKDDIREICLNPPKTPFAIVLSDIPADFIYRTPANEKIDNGVVLTLNGDLIEYDPANLKWRIELASHIGAALSTIKKKLTDDLPAESKHRILNDAMSKRYRHGKVMLKTWLEIRGDPQSKLAVWLSPSDSECESMYQPGIGMEIKKKSEAVV